MLHDWCLAGHGIAWRSTWEVEAEIDAGLLVPLLDEFAAPPNGIYAVFPQRKHLPLRVRLWLDFLKHAVRAARVLGRHNRPAMTPQKAPMTLEAILPTCTSWPS